MEARQEPQTLSIEEASRCLPIVDLAHARYPGGEGAVVAALRGACETVGFFYLAGHGIDPGLTAGAFAASRQFHALPLEEKLAVRVNAEDVGYLPVEAGLAKHDVAATRNRNFNESFIITHEQDEAHPVPSPNVWPEGRERMRAAMVGYFRAVDALAWRLARLLRPVLGGSAADGSAPRPAPPQVYVSMRFLHFPARRPEGQEFFGQRPHFDLSLLTILARDEVPGLMVRLPDQRWILPPAIPDTFLINTGKAMERLTAGRLQPPLHAVRNPPDGADRYSIAYFFGGGPMRRYPEAAGPAA